MLSVRMIQFVILILMGVIGTHIRTRKVIPNMIIMKDSCQNKRLMQKDILTRVFVLWILKQDHIIVSLVR